VYGKNLGRKNDVEGGGRGLIPDTVVEAATAKECQLGVEYIKRSCRRCLSSVSTALAIILVSNFLGLQCTVLEVFNAVKCNSILLKLVPVAKKC